MATPNANMKINVVENSGPNTLLSFLQHAGDSAVSIDIAAAFLTLSGVNAILYVLKKVARKGSVRVLTGLYQGFTEPDALRKLFQIQEETKGRLSVSISHDGHFHWKCYFVKGPKSARLVVGSSNLTGDGLRQTGEFNVVLTVATDSKPYQDLTVHFETHWKGRSTPLSDVILEKYEDWKEKVGSPDPLPSVPIRKILGGNTAARRKKEVLTRRFWRTGITGYCSDETVTILKDTTNWERRGYNYFSTWNRSFQEGDRVILFDLKDKVIRIMEIKDTTETPIVTPDGVHFAAYKVVHGIPERKLVANRWRFLKASNLLKRRGDAENTRKLSEGTFEKYVENMKQTAPSKKL